MTTRTLKFYGRGYGTTPASISVTQNGVNVYTGTVTTINAATTDPADQVELFTSETTVDFSGTIPMTVEVTNGTVIFAWITGNYCNRPNPVYSNAQLTILRDPATTNAEKIAIYSSVAVPSFSAAELAVLETGTTVEVQAILKTHNAQIALSTGPTGFSATMVGDQRSNVYIDGVLQSTPNPRPSGRDGTWYWAVNQGSVLSYDLGVDAGFE
jgi:hypothetical protein